ncbi:MAG: CoB--CoM heterodisulfide reductase iron-sulfur subunit B family protein [Acidobacteriota bacterium]|nr:CoB--CoM heterodisulfide reductase iron-sulfur subunit B family protein [Acidobacteriota bacterium]
MRYAYYPGCSLHSTGSEFDLSLRAVSPRLGLELEEVEGWICCGSTPAHSVSGLLALALPVANLSLVERMRREEVVVPCASCFRRLKAGHHETTESPEVMERVNAVVEPPYQGTVEIRHPLEILSAPEMLRRISTLATKDLSHLRVACYYGCLLTRPPEVMRFDRHEYPMSMDTVLRAAGITTLEWNSKTMCCGAAFSLTETEIVYKLTADILEEARAAGANASAVACPLCHANLDTRQSEIEERLERTFGLPAFYFTQLLGLAMGIPAGRLGIGKHLVDAGGLLPPEPEPLMEAASVVVCRECDLPTRGGGNRE